LTNKRLRRQSSGRFSVAVKERGHGTDRAGHHPGVGDGAGAGLLEVAPQQGAAMVEGGERPTAAALATEVTSRLSKLPVESAERAEARNARASSAVWREQEHMRT